MCQPSCMKSELCEEMMRVPVGHVVEDDVQVPNIVKQDELRRLCRCLEL